MFSPQRGNRSVSPESPVGMPRWVKVFLIVAAVLVVLLVAVLLVGGGQHGPGRHQTAVGQPTPELLSPWMTGSVIGMTSATSATSATGPR